MTPNETAGPDGAGHGRRSSELTPRARRYLVDGQGASLAGPLSLRGIARALGGEVAGLQILCPGPNHGPKDRSLSVTLSATADDGFIVHSHAGDAWEACRDHVRQRLGIERRRIARGPQLTQDAARPPDNNHHRVLDIIRQLRPILGSPGEAYLHDERGINVDAILDSSSRPTPLAGLRSISTSRAMICMADLSAVSSA